MRSSLAYAVELNGGVYVVSTREYADMNTKSMAENQIFFAILYVGAVRAPPLHRMVLSRYTS